MLAILAGPFHFVTADAILATGAFCSVGKKQLPGQSARTKIKATI
jgi:hypothetical protein